MIGGREMECEDEVEANNHVRYDRDVGGNILFVSPIESIPIRSHATFFIMHNISINVF